MAILSFKKGETIFKEGDKITSLYLIQSGAVSLCVVRPKKNIELYQLAANHLLGETALTGMQNHSLSAVATAETKVLEISVEALKKDFESLPQVLKVLLKSLLDRYKISVTDLKNFRMERDSSPCPDDQVAKVFGAIFHTVHHKGEKDEKNKELVRMDWTMMRHYAQRVFMESPKRLEQALCILVKLKQARFIMGKSPENPNGPDEIQTVEFLDLSTVEHFFEFFQYYYFKGGKTDLLKVDDLCLQILKGFISCSEGQAPDRMGIMSLDYTVILQIFKDQLGLNLNPDHLSRLESKGVFIKRKTQSQGPVLLQFEVAEIKRTIMNWRLLKELARWNEKGFVDLNEPEVEAKKKTSGHLCPQCQAEIKENQKFCAECGHKIAA